jgi:RimJ/RimL family protein N-acetyltransferase
MADSGTLRGERVTLRHMVRADVDAMATWPSFHEPDLQWANLDLNFPSERDAYFERGRTNETRRRFVVLDEQNHVIGTVGLRNLDFNASEATLGIIIRADVVGHGYGTDSVKTVLRYAFDILELDRVLLDVAINNRRARHVYDKLGFVPVGQHLGPQSVVYVDMLLERASYARSNGQSHLNGHPRHHAG